LTATLDGQAYTSREKHTRFYAVTTGHESASASITLKLPEGIAGTVRVLVNGNPVAAFDAKECWSTHRFDIPADVFVPDVSVISVEWPAYQYTPQYEGDDVEAMSEWLMDNLHPLYGKIHQFTLEQK
jgi:hypothetical protein